MYSAETGVYTALLTGLAALAVIIVFFLVTIIRFQRRKTALYYSRLSAEISMLENERLRIAKDLHDDLGSTLAGIKLKLHCLEPEKEENMVIAEQSGKYIDDAIVKLRHISLNIMPQVLQRSGLKPALDELLKMLLSSAAVTVNASYDIALPPGSDIGIHIYRIVQEMLTNIIKHANASRVNICITISARNINLHISDNGLGFNRRLVLKNNNGQGLHNIMSRVDLLNARIYLTTGPGKGTDYIIKIPL